MEKDWSEKRHQQHGKKDAKPLSTDKCAWNFSFRVLRISFSGRAAREATAAE